MRHEIITHELVDGEVHEVGKVNGALVKDYTALRKKRKLNIGIGVEPLRPRRIRVGKRRVEVEI